jgi:hypothetical protein
MLDRRVPLVVVSRLARGVRLALDISDFEHLITQNHLLTIPRA